MISMSNPKTENLIPFEIEGEMTYLNPDSAEGKALQRIDSLDPDDPKQWITIVDDQDISSEQVKQLKREGWQIKTVNEVREESDERCNSYCHVSTVCANSINL